VVDRLREDRRLVRALQRKDAQSLRRWRDDFVPVLEKIVAPEGRTPPVPAAERRVRLEKSREGRLLLAASELSPQEFVLREFEHPVVQAGLLFFNGLREVDLRCKGFGHHIPVLLAAAGKAQMCIGGSAGLARALVDAVEESGGEIRCGVEPRRISSRTAGRSAWRPWRASASARVRSSSRALTHSRPSSN
jgi:phytoene dehydrogenase-like protein